MTTVKFTFHQMTLIPWYDSFLLKLGKRKREREGWGERDSEIFGNRLPRLRGWPSAGQGGRQEPRGCVDVAAWTSRRAAGWELGQGLCAAIEENSDSIVSQKKTVSSLKAVRGWHEAPPRYEGQRLHSKSPAADVDHVYKKYLYDNIETRV